MIIHTYATGKYPRTHRKPYRPVTILRVNPLVWAHAIRLAHGDGRRIQITGPDSVIVWNHPGTRYGHR